MRKITVGFFRADKPVSEAIRTKLLEFSEQPRPTDTSRTVVINGETPVVLRNIREERDGDFLLDFTRIRNVPAMDLSDSAGNEERINFTGDRRPAEYAVAIFDCVSRVLAVHETTLGITPSMVARYWQMIIPDLQRFRFDPILEQRAADLIMAAGAFSSFSLSLAHMGSEERMRSLGLTDNEILDLIKTYSSPNISVTFKIDPRGDRKTLAVERIRQLATSLLGLGKEHVKKLSLITEDEDGSPFPINLLKDRIVFTEPLTIEEREEMTDEVRYRAIRNGWNARKNELRSRYRNVE